MPSIMRLSSNPTCGKCGTEEETSVHILCECEALASLRHAHLVTLFLDPENIMNLSMGGSSGTLVKEQGSFKLVSVYGAQRAYFKIWVHRARKCSKPKYYSIIF